MWGAELVFQPTCFYLPGIIGYGLQYCMYHRETRRQMRKTSRLQKVTKIINVVVYTSWLKSEGGGREGGRYTDKKEDKIFLVFKEIQSGAVAKSYMRKGFLIYEEMRKNVPIYEDWGGCQSYMTLQLIHSEFPYIWGKFYFISYQCRLGVFFCMTARVHGYSCAQRSQTESLHKLATP